MLHKYVQQIDFVPTGGKILSCESEVVIRPSIYTNLLYRNLIQYFCMELKQHPLFLVSFYLNPLFREIWFISDTTERQNMGMKAEEFTINLSRSHLVSNPDPSARFGEEAVDIEISSR